MTTYSSKKQLNYSIELLRIVCTLMVIGIHTLMNFRTVNGDVAMDVLYLEAFLRSSVPLFFMISGFFIFKSKKSSTHLLKQFFFKILIPTFLMFIALQVFDNFLHSRSSFLQDLMNFQIDFRDLFSHFAIFSSDAKNGFYLWYVFSLTYIYLWIPLLRFVCIDSPQANKTRYFIESLCFLSTILLPTIIALIPSLHGKIIIPTVLTDHYLLYFLIGFELRLLSDKNPNLFKKKAVQLSSFALYLTATAISIFLAIQWDIRPDNQLNNTFYRYEMANIFIQSIALFTLFLTFKIKNKTFSSWISYAGNKMFYVYLFHWPVMLKFLDNQMAATWKNYLGLAFYPLFIFGTFIICFLISVLIQTIQSQAKPLFYKKKIDSIKS